MCLNQVDVSYLSPLPCLASPSLYPFLAPFSYFTAGGNYATVQIDRMSAGALHCRSQARLPRQGHIPKRQGPLENRGFQETSVHQFPGDFTYFRIFPTRVSSRCASGVPPTFPPSLACAKRRGAVLLSCFSLRVPVVMQQGLGGEGPACCLSPRTSALLCAPPLGRPAPSLRRTRASASSTQCS